MNESLSSEWSSQSWIESANDPACGFPLRGLPYCVFASEDRPHVGVGIGSLILDLQKCSSAGTLRGLQDAALEACKAETLNPLIACGSSAQTDLRSRLMELLDDSAPDSARVAAGEALVPMQGARLLKPVEPA